MVSTAVGCEGIGVHDGEHLLIAKSAEDFAAAIVRLLDDRELGGRLGAAGRRFVEKEYSWETAGGGSRRRTAARLGRLRLGAPGVPDGRRACDYAGEPGA